MALFRENMCRQPPVDKAGKIIVLHESKVSGWIIAKLAPGLISKRSLIAFT
jgi:hypothetical protein